MTKYLTAARRLDEGVGTTAGALSNPSRRLIITRLCRGPATTSELAVATGAALPTMQQHLERLRAAGLVTSAKHGRVVTHRAELAPLLELESWIVERRSFWNTQLAAPSDALEPSHDN